MNRINGISNRGACLAILAAGALAALAMPAPVAAVAVNPEGGYYKPSFPANQITTIPGCPIDACENVDSTGVYEEPLQSAIAELEPFTIQAGNTTEIDVENLDVSFSCIDPRQEDVEDCEDQAWDAYEAAVNGTQSKPGPWSDFAGAWEDYQDALADCQNLLNGPYAGYSSVVIEGDLSSGNSEGSVEVTAKLEIDLCRSEVCLTDIEYSYDMGGWVGFWGSLFGGSTTMTLVDGNGDHYPLSGGTGSICIPLSDVL